MKNIHKNVFITSAWLVSVALLFIIILVPNYHKTAAQATTTGTTTPIIDEPLGGSCSVQVYSYNTNDRNLPGRMVIFKAIPNGGNGTYTYSWTGSEGIQGTTQNIQQLYTTAGLKTATVVVNSGSRSASFTCTTTLSDVSPDTQGKALGASCVMSDPLASTQKDSSWLTSISGGDGHYTIVWSGDLGSSTSPITGSSTSISVRYTTPGLKTVNVHVASPALGDTLDFTCQAIVASTTPTTFQSGCFIATAAYGTPDEPQVETLRKFRDEKLLTNDLGTKFVEFYYQNSPPIAAVIKQHDSLRAVTRVVLQPIVYLARKVVDSDK